MYILVGAGVFVVLAAELAVGVIGLRDGRTGREAGRDAATAGSPSRAAEERGSDTEDSP